MSRTQRFKDLIDPVLHEVFSREQEHLRKQREDFFLENAVLGGTTNAFRVDGLAHYLTHARDFRGVPVKPLDSSLMDRFQVHQKKSKNIKRDCLRIRQALSVVLARCDSFQNCRDVLPEVIVTQIPAFRGLERMDEEGFVLREDPRLLAQYQSSMEIALVYHANRLLF